MYNTDIELMERVLMISDKKIEIKKRVTTLSIEGYNLDKKELIKCLKEGFEETYGKSKKDNISKEELSLARKLSLEKYQIDRWNQKR
jgi:lipoate-protein ligase A